MHVHYLLLVACQCHQSSTHVGICKDSVLWAHSQVSIVNSDYFYMANLVFLSFPTVVLFEKFQISSSSSLKPELKVRFHLSHQHVPTGSELDISIVSALGFLLNSIHSDICPRQLTWLHGMSGLHDLPAPTQFCHLKVLAEISRRERVNLIYLFSACVRLWHLFTESHGVCQTVFSIEPHS